MAAYKWEITSHKQEWDAEKIGFHGFKIYGNFWTSLDSHQGQESGIYF